MLKDRSLDSRTAKDYSSYIKKLDGREISYDLYLEIAGNKWAVKAVRVYLDYLYRTGRLSREDLHYWKEIFKVKNKNEIKNYSVDVEKLIGWIKGFKRSKVYSTILLTLYYSGARLSEVIRMIHTFDEKKLVCFDSLCRYALFWSRGRKRCNLIYMPRDLVDGVKELEKVGSYDNIRDHLYDEYKIESKWYRKLFYQICVDTIADRTICDFYQSRISNMRIGDIAYDNLLKRADENYMKTKERLDQLISQHDS